MTPIPNKLGLIQDKVNEFEMTITALLGKLLYKVRRLCWANRENYQASIKIERARLCHNNIGIVSLPEQMEPTPSLAFVS